MSKIYEEYDKTTSSSGVNCKIEDRVGGSVVIRNPISFTVFPGYKKSLEVAGVER